MKILDTQSFFAPAGRATDTLLQHQQGLASSSELVNTLLDAMPDFLMILNEQRQVVAVNQRLLTAFGVDAAEELLGLRPGEAIGCAHVKDGPDGCGTSQNCSVCGAVIAILTAQQSGQPAQRECQLMLDKGCQALDLDILATPISIEGERFTVLALRDIGPDKRRAVIERVFFHDVLNNAGGIRGLASLLVDQNTSHAAEQQYKKWLVELADGLIDEINYHQRLLQAERGSFRPSFEQIDLQSFLQEIQHLYGNHPKAPGRVLVMEEPEPCLMVSDPLLLRRVIGNMVMNALEASQPGQTVVLRGYSRDGRLRIMVTNQGEMADEIRLQIFNRSFSTKVSNGRGLGTYSMKLFGERYLGGCVGFSSADGMTTFYIDLPTEPLDSSLGGSSPAA